jgi:hypothetical protein
VLTEMAGRVPRLPYVLLILMTIASFGGPVGIGVVLRGGASPNWPPDRTVEWVAFAGVTGLVVALMIACLSIGWWNQREIRRAKTTPNAQRRGEQAAP